MCRSKAVHECDELINEPNFEDGDLSIGAVKNEGKVSVKLVIENSHSVKAKSDTRDPS